jgi:hypothetical protein
MTTFIRVSVMIVITVSGSSQCFFRKTSITLFNLKFPDTPYRFIIVFQFSN